MHNYRSNFPSSLVPVVLTIVLTIWLWFAYFSNNSSESSVNITTLNSVMKAPTTVLGDIDCRDQVHPDGKVGGVAVSLLLEEPKWFQRRYTMMVNNIRANIPPDWKIQLFYAKSGLSLEGIQSKA